MKLQTAVNMLPVEGGTILAPNWQWDVYDAVVFPVGKQVPGYITNVCFQGESSGLACGSVGNPFGTRLNFSGPGTMFDLRGQKCINVQFRDFEVFDTNGSQETIGINAVNFGTGCVIENVGFKNFWKSVVLSGESYYSKLDRMVSFGARHTGFEIHNPNMTDIHRCQASYGAGTGLRVYGGLGTLIDGGGHYENNAGHGIEVIGERHVVIQNNYVEQNVLGDINIHDCASGEISGNIRVRTPECAPFITGTRLSEINIHGNTEI